MCSDPSTPNHGLFQGYQLLLLNKLYFFLQKPLHLLMSDLLRNGSKAQIERKLFINLQQTSERCISSKSIFAPIDCKTSCAESIISGPTPSPGMRVQVTLPFGVGLALTAAEACNAATHWSFGSVDTSMEKLLKTPWLFNHTSLSWFKFIWNFLSIGYRPVQKFWRKRTKESLFYNRNLKQNHN